MNRILKSRILKLRWVGALAVFLAGAAVPIESALAGDSANGGASRVANQSRNGSGLPAAEAQRGGTTGTANAVAMPATGFNCPEGETWGFQDGVLKCASPVTDGVRALKGKVVYIRANLIGGFVSGSILRLTGGERDLRVDSLDLNNQVVSTCFLNVAEQICHMGLGGGANPNLAEDPKLSGAGHGAGQRTYTAKEFVAWGVRYTGSMRGGPLQDHYILSTWTDQAGLRVDVLGLYWALDGGLGLLTPVLSTDLIPMNRLAAARNGATFTLVNAWAAPLGLGQ